MNRKLFLCFFVLGILSVVVITMGRTAWAEEGEVLSVERALEIAEKVNPVLSASEEQINQARERLEQARAAELPTLAVSLMAQQTHEDPVYPVSGWVLDKNGKLTEMKISGFAQSGFRQTYRAALKMTYVLYSSGTVQYNKRARKLALRAVEAQSDRTRQAVENGVRKSYYGLQRSRAKLTVAEDAEKLAREHLIQVDSFYRHGMVARNQVLRVQVDVSGAELNRISASNAVDVSWRALERAVGRPLRDDFVLPEPERSIEEISLPEDPRAVALSSRPELTALEFSGRSATSSARAADGQNGPQVILQGELSDVDEHFFPNNGKTDDWKVTLAAEWSLYDGGRARAQAREARSAAREYVHRMEDFRNQIDLEISSAMLNLRSARQRFRVAQDQVKSAAEDYRIALKRYRANVGTNIDVLDARVAYNNARTQLVDAIYDIYSARSDLKFAMGSCENH